MYVVALQRVGCTCSYLGLQPAEGLDQESERSSKLTIVSAIKGTELRKAVNHFECCAACNGRMRKLLRPREHNCKHTLQKRV